MDILLTAVPRKDLPTPALLGTAFQEHWLLDLDDPKISIIHDEVPF